MQFSSFLLSLSLLTGSSSTTTDSLFLHYQQNQQQQQYFYYYNYYYNLKHNSQYQQSYSDQNNINHYYSSSSSSSVHNHQRYLNTMASSSLPKSAVSRSAGNFFATTADPTTYLDFNIYTRAPLLAALDFSHIDPVAQLENFESSLTDSPSELAQFIATMVFFLMTGSNYASAMAKKDSKFRQFIQDAVMATGVSESAIVLSLKYISEIKKKLKFSPNGSVEYRIWVTSLMLADTFLNDNAYTCKSWAKVTNLSPLECATMRREFLDALDYRIFISEKEYAEWLDSLESYMSTMMMDGNNDNKNGNNMNNYNDNKNTSSSSSIINNTSTSINVVRSNNATITIPPHTGGSPFMFTRRDGTPSPVSPVALSSFSLQSNGNEPMVVLSGSPSIRMSGQFTHQIQQQHQQQLLNAAANLAAPQDQSRRRSLPNAMIPNLAQIVNPLQRGLMNISTNASASTPLNSSIAPPVGLALVSQNASSANIPSGHQSAVLPHTSLTTAARMIQIPVVDNMNVFPQVALRVPNTTSTAIGGPNPISSNAISSVPSSIELTTHGGMVTPSMASTTNNNHSNHNTVASISKNFFFANNNNGAHTVTGSPSASSPRSSSVIRHQRHHSTSSSIPSTMATTNNIPLLNTYHNGTSRSAVSTPVTTSATAGPSMTMSFTPSSVSTTAASNTTNNATTTAAAAAVAAAAMAQQYAVHQQQQDALVRQRILQQQLNAAAVVAAAQVRAQAQAQAQAAVAVVVAASNQQTNPTVTVNQQQQHVNLDYSMNIHQATLAAVQQQQQLQLQRQQQQYLQQNSMNNTNTSLQHQGHHDNMFLD